MLNETERTLISTAVDGELTPSETEWLVRNLKPLAGRVWDRQAMRHFGPDVMAQAQVRLLAVVPDERELAAPPLCHDVRRISEQVLASLPAGWTDALRCGHQPTIAIVQAVVRNQIAESAARCQPRAATDPLTSVPTRTLVP